MRIRISITLMFLAFVLVFSSCNRGEVSRTTGWKYNDKNGTGFEVRKKKGTPTPLGMVHIEGGAFTMGERTEFVTAPRNSQRRTVTVSSFYMDQYEIRNLDWREYSDWMRLVFRDVAPELIDRAQPNKDAWREELAYNEPYLEHYFTHPAYQEYPVVGVTWEQAVDYCKWRTDRVNELALVSGKFIEAPDFQALESMDYDEIINDFIFNTQKYIMQDVYEPTVGRKEKTDVWDRPRKVDMSDGIFVSDFRLPTEAEWEYAAYAITAKDDGFTPEGRVYPWGGSQIRNQSKKYMGRMQANFVRGRGDMMGVAGDLNDGAAITTAVDSYFPNDFGLYCMAGNVNEWVLDVYRSTSFDEVAEYNSFRGNIYEEPVVFGYDEYGKPEYELDSLGRIKMQPVERGDVRNYRDGDAPSQLSTEYRLENYFEGMDYLMGTEDQKIDITDVLAPRITNTTRVYKGGSWKDRAFWLHPSSRRFLEQNKSTNDIGFRCAMSVIGDKDMPVKGKDKKRKK